MGPTAKIAAGVLIESYAVIGTSAEHRDFMRSEPEWSVIVGENTIVREFVTINAGTNRPTYVGPNCNLLRGSHVGHDAILEAGVTLSCNVMIGGHAWIGQKANIGLGAVVHQYRAVGGMSMIGMQSAVTKDIPPFVKAYGVPAKISGLNLKLLESLVLNVPEIMANYSLELPSFENEDLREIYADWLSMCKKFEAGPWL